MADNDDLDQLIRAIQGMRSADEDQTADEVAERVGNGIAAAAQRRKEREAEVPKIAPRFDPSFNWGHVFTVLTIVGGFMFAYTSYVSDKNVQNANIGVLTASVTKYAPMIETASKLNEVQDERIQNLNVALADLRRSFQDSAGDARRRDGEIMGILGTLREDMAQVKAKLSIERR